MAKEDKPEKMSIIGTAARTVASTFGGGIGGTIAGSAIMAAVTAVAGAALGAFAPGADILPNLTSGGAVADLAALGGIVGGIGGALAGGPIGALAGGGAGFVNSMPESNEIAHQQELARAQATGIAQGATLAQVAMLEQRQAEHEQASKWGERIRAEQTAAKATTISLQ